MKYWILHHQHKGKPIEEALRSQKWVYSQTPDIALFDTARNNRIADMFRKKKSTLVLYPHTAIAAWWYDGLMELSDNYAAMLVIGEGQKQVQQIITPNMRTEIIGWGYCPILPFNKPKVVKRIVFAPIHPSGDTLRPEARDVNARVYKRLLSLPNVQIVLRVIGKLEDNGLWYSPKTIVKAGKPDGSYAEIDIADLVIAEGMYLSLAVARGKPAIGMNQRIAIKVNRSGHVPERWDEYNHLQAYPIDFDDGDIMELIDRASQESSVKEWKDRFIGEQLQPKKLSDLLIDIRGQNAR